MANIALRVELTSPSAVGSITGLKLESTSKVANTSYKVGSDNYYTGLPTSTFAGSNGLVWAGDSGELVINDNSMLDNLQNSDGFVEDEENPEEFFWGLTDANGEYELTLKIEGSGMSLVTIFGDTVNQQFPIEAYLDGSTTPIYSDDPQWVIQFPSTANSHTIRFTKWNRKGYNAALTLIRITSSSYDLTTFTGLNDVKVTLQRNTNPQELEYGVVPNSGTFEMTDTDGEVEDLIRDGILPISNLPVDYYVNGKRKSRHITRDSNYSTDRTASASMSNNISNWDNIQFKGRAYTGTQTTLYTMLLDILNSTIFNNKLTSTTFDSLLIGLSKSILQEIYTAYDYVEPDTLRNTVDKVCAVAQLNCYEVAENDYPYNIRFAHAMPAEYNTVQVLTIPERYQASQPTRDIILRNKYDGVEIQECQVKDEVISRTNVYNFKLDSLPSGITNSYSKADIYEDSVGQVTPHYAYNYAGVVLSYETITLPTIIIPKRDELNLNEIRNVYKGVDAGGNANITYSVVYEKTEISGVNYQFDYQISPRIDTLSWGGGTEGTPKSASGQLPDLSISAEYTTLVQSKNVSASLDLGESSNVKTVGIKDNGNSYSISGLQIVIYQYRGTISGATQTYSSPQTTFIVQGNAEKYQATQLDVSFLGDKRTITFDNFEAKQSANFATAKTIARIDENQLLTNRLNYTSSSVGYTATLMNNLLTDYKDGIATAKVTVFCGDIYDTAGNMVREWAKGETYELGDIVRVDKDNAGNTEWYYKNGDPYYWRITGLTHRYSGAPYIDLELQEVRLISP